MLPHPHHHHHGHHFDDIFPLAAVGAHDVGGDSEAAGMIERITDTNSEDNDAALNNLASHLDQRVPYDYGMIHHGDHMGAYDDVHSFDGEEGERGPHPLLPGDGDSLMVGFLHSEVLLYIKKQEMIIAVLHEKWVSYSLYQHGIETFYT